MAEEVWMQMHPDDPSLADGARARLQKLSKSRATIFGSHTSANSHNGDAPDPLQGLQGQNMSDVPVDFKDLRNHRDDGNCDRDLFRWAILYENQRGLTLFSAPYYSSRSLLPWDPQPFTVPQSGPSSPSPHPYQSPPNVSPTTYLLPNPTWRWVSKTWLVDMRGDGDVQHDGFEYNWYFRSTHWRPRVSWFSAGGFVRRRRWIRLMMRPSDTRRQAEDAIHDHAYGDTGRLTSSVSEQGDVWKGDADDWTRVHVTLKAHTRDGPRLELWAKWLADFVGAPERTHSQMWTEDDDNVEVKPTVNPDAEKPDADLEANEHPSRRWILAVLRSHLNDVYNLFIYPDSRAELRDMFLRAGLVQDIFIGTPDSSQIQCPGPRDFWSRTTEPDLSVNRKG